ncbi:polyphosphate kinase 2 family protein [Acetobacter tropicalis]|uniref:Polyphosphate:AMP phosphotransferase n=2 Tax=Acetobacter TaxID=434 RepID=A0A0U5EWE5_9PROT|nr:MULTISPECIES: polyphosphate kinase 2 family protein [Acetobacter]ATJ89532.1 polyphosphate--nucleotide phosphotransferase [Acetobacter tropicalis]KXV61242.1 polyphosphate:nucleotide phosphotransferase [Acetobacter senegalensis]MCG4254712.1 polyphosphate kinase 2 family protein [Acetobacter senegalensis]MCG4258849.1 polyphosphate kinase 2 family protein [Acetobacter senegalensis]MCG4268752.1 polyphosphate kinase 2 family protein [Acetobacter senegalensis]
MNKLAKFLRALDSYHITDGDKFDLKDHNPNDDGDLGLTKADGAKLLKTVKKRLLDLQDLLYANQTHSVLIILQGMDAAGKDGTIKHVMSGVNPQGVSVTSFKQPGPTELLHGFLWRIHLAAPQVGRIVIFNRSQYEDVLVTRVHPELLEHEHLSGEINTPEFWAGRYSDIRHLEHYLSRQGTIVLKFFLNISREEQRERLLARLDIPDKRWKFSPSDLREREYWDDYQKAYQAAISETARPYAPWIIVPSNHKWYARLVVIGAIIRALQNLQQQAPKPAPEVGKFLDDYRARLLKEQP